jgi:hypothetical protein
MLTDRMNVFTCAPHNDLLGARQDNEAYCLANPGTEYAVYFPKGGEVTLDVDAAGKPLTVQWLDIMKSTWSDAKRVEPTATLTLKCPSEDYWAVLVK